MAYDILVNGKDPATMDIEFVPEDKLTKEYDAARCKALGLKVVERLQGDRKLNIATMPGSRNAARFFVWLIRRVVRWWRDWRPLLDFLRRIW